MDQKQLPLTFSCTESWEAMPGDDRRRRCGKCEKEVVDLSARSALGARLTLGFARRDPCVRYAVNPDGRVQFRPSRLAKLAAAALALLPAVARAEAPAEAPSQEVHLCSPPAQPVYVVGGIRRGFRILPDLSGLARFWKPQGDALAHLELDPARWTDVAVKCEGSLLARHERTRSGEVTVYDLPDGAECTAKLSGDARPLRIHFVAGKTFTQAERAEEEG